MFLIYKAEGLVIGVERKGDPFQSNKHVSTRRFSLYA